MENIKQNHMLQETHEAHICIQKQLKINASLIESITKHLKTKNITTAITIARGSSDHAANFAKYLLETQLGIITASSAPSVNTVYKSKINMKNMLVIGISQSGQSPDICQVMQYAKDQGAITIAIVNNASSNLARAAEFVIPIHAGEEKAVAATKSFMCTLSALLQLVGIYNSDKKLLDALNKLPEQLNMFLQSKKYPQWNDAVASLKNAKNMFVIARGTSYPIAQESALKFKETACIQAEPFSSAEVLHGPFALVRPNFYILQYAQDDITLKSNLELAQKMTKLGAHTLLVYPENIKIENKSNIAQILLPIPSSLHPLTDAVMIIQAFYQMANKLAISLGFDPDNPENLKKVTETK